MKFSRVVLTAAILTLVIAGFAVRSTPQTTTNIKTVWIILMENHNWSQILGSKNAPYINNSLLPMASHAEQFFNPPGIHPSEPNYLWLEAGTNFGILDDNEPAVNHQSTTQHLVTFLQNKGITWKSYQENIDGTTCPLVSSGLYATKHNPFVFFDDVTSNLDPNSANCIAHIRPFTEITNDLTSGNVAAYNFITPNLCDDMHDRCKPHPQSNRAGRHLAVHQPAANSELGGVQERRSRFHHLG